MAVMDEFKEEREALKNGSLKDKISYFWLYYKWYVIGGIVALLFIINMVFSILNQTEDALFGVFINSISQEGAEDYLQAFADRMEIDTEEYSITIDSSLYYEENSLDESTMGTLQKMMVYIAAGEIDMMISGPAAIERYANNETFVDLREVLTKEQREKYEPYFYYIDLNAVSEKDENFMDENYSPSYPDPTKPQEMVQPVPVGIYLSDCEKFLEHYLFTDETVIFGIVVNSSRQEAALAFLDYIFEF